jgi:PhnB protein
VTAERENWIAPGRSRVSTFITVPEAMDVVRFAEAAFGAERVSEPFYRSDGRLWNVEIRIGDSTIMLGDGGSEMVRTAFVYVYVPDVHTAYDAAVAAGATPVMEPSERFYGAVDGGVEDVAGNLWWIATHVEDLSHDEIVRRAAEEEARR